jgi:ABC-2 type transport system ATP-binding protein
MPFAIEVEHLVKEYARRNDMPLRAVDDISFRVGRGEIFGLLGPNGAGKTTTIKILTTLIPATSGTARLMGYSVATMPLDVRRNICVVLQQDAIDIHLSVWNNFKTFGRFHGLTGSTFEREAARVIELFGLEEFLRDKGMDLSGGTKRRVQVAKMFIVDKPVIFLDEATTGMDTFNKRTTMEAIREESGKGRTIILTTHLLDEAEELCGALAIVNHGRIIAQGSTNKVKAMGLQLIDVVVATENVSSAFRTALKKAKPIRIEERNGVFHISVRTREAALSVANLAERMTKVVSLEITSASLEDAFVELIDKKEVTRA